MKSDIQPVFYVSEHNAMCMVNSLRRRYDLTPTKEAGDIAWGHARTSSGMRIKLMELYSKYQGFTIVHPMIMEPQQYIKVDRLTKMIQELRCGDACARGDQFLDEYMRMLKHTRVAFVEVQGRMYQQAT